MNKKNNLKSIKRNTKQAKYIIENKDKLIQKRKRKRKIRRNIIIIVFLTAILFTMAIKLPYFNIKSFKVLGNKNVKISEVERSYKNYLNQNIFLFKSKDLRENLKTNKYIEDVTIKRKLPNEILINIVEKEASFYFKDKNQYCLINSDGEVLESISDIKNRNITELKGFSYKDLQVDVLVLSERHKSLLKKFLSLINSNTSKIKITSIDIYDYTNISVYSNGIKIIIGTEYNLKDKLNKGINIIEAHKIKDKKGYVDVSYEGNPVVFTQ